MCLNNQEGLSLAGEENIGRQYFLRSVNSSCTYIRLRRVRGRGLVFCKLLTLQPDSCGILISASNGGFLLSPQTLWNSCHPVGKKLVLSDRSCRMTTYLGGCRVLFWSSEQPPPQRQVRRCGAKPGNGDAEGRRRGGSVGV